MNCVSILILCVIPTTLAVEYVYDRPICTGLGDRVGDLMTLATMARLQSATVVFEWCKDPSVIYPRIRQHIPEFHGWQYDLSEFKQRFNPPPELLLVHNLSQSQRHSKLKVMYDNLEVPSEAGLNCMYTTAFKTMRLSDVHIDLAAYKHAYHSVTMPVVRHVKTNEKTIVQSYAPYIVLHMRGPDKNNYNPFPGCHDDLKYFCTKKVLKHVVKLNVKVIGITNNVEWMTDLLSNTEISILNGTSAFDDFALLIGATSIVQHALHGWSAYSTIPAIMGQIPLITSYKKTQPHHRYDLFKRYGGVPDELHDCDGLKTFLLLTKQRLESHEQSIQSSSGVFSTYEAKFIFNAR